jgi:Ca2+/Na+ antiporter
VAARLVVTSGLELASLLGAPPILLGAKLTAIGTSLPELTTDFSAVRRGRVHLAIGGIIGSNLTLVLGLVLLTSPFAVDTEIFRASSVPVDNNSNFLAFSHKRRNLQNWRITPVGVIPAFSSIRLILRNI